MKSENYIPQLLTISEKENIDLIIPTIDTDLQILAENKDKFKRVNSRVLISNSEMIKICRDKNLTANFFRQCGLNSPDTFNNYKKYNLSYPAFIKPKDGSSSIGANKAYSYSELILYSTHLSNYIIQPFIDGTEYTIDIFCDFGGNALSIVPRERIAVRSGEVLKTKIFMDKIIIQEAEAVIKNFKPCGPLTVQLIRDKKTNQDYFIEINPRFGGGAPLSIKAGARSPEFLLKLLSGENIKPFNFKLNKISDGAVYSRFDQSVNIKFNNKINLNKISGVIFDLDDTLYPESEYVYSGFKAVAAHLGDIKYAEKLFEFFKSGRPAIDELLKLLDEINLINLKNLKNLKSECLKIYREHIPDIKLYSGVEDLLMKLKNFNIKTGIITDGRPEGQKNKIKALRLNELIKPEDIIITDELGGAQFRKPNDIAFRIMRTRWRIPYENILYIGDNLNKDFQAPNQLGMQTLFFENPDGLYYKNKNKTQDDQALSFYDGKASSIECINKILENSLDYIPSSAPPP